MYTDERNNKRFAWEKRREIQMGITTIFLLLGGLGLFLFGMKLMSDGLEQVAGARMRSILEFFTKNRFVGMLVGILFTAVVHLSLIQI